MTQKSHFVNPRFDILCRAISHPIALPIRVCESPVVSLLFRGPDRFRRSGAYNRENAGKLPEKAPATHSLQRHFTSLRPDADREREKMERTAAIK